jgi:hypothetical protein
VFDTNWDLLRFMGKAILFTADTVSSIQIMETNTLVKFCATVGAGYVVLLATLAGSIPYSVSAVGLVLVWALGKRIDA